MPLPFSYTLRRSLRASKVRISVSLNKVEVIAPPQIPEELIQQFVLKQQQWVITALEKVADKHKKPAEPSAFYQPGTALVFQGGHYAIRLKPTSAKRLKVEFSEGFTVHIPEDLPPTNRPAAIKSALAAWLKKQAKQKVGNYVEKHAEKYGLMPRSITIKSQKSRWGSCGIHNDIHINWLLMAAPPEVLEYVVVHELCHLRVKNHSAKFWALVAAHLPDYTIRRQWLKRHGADLMASWW